MRITTHREVFAMTNPWLREADLPQIQGPRPGADKQKGTGNQPNLPGLPQQLDVSSAPWLQHDWKTAQDYGDFHSQSRPPMSSDIPHPSEVLDPNNKQHTKPRVYSVKNPKTKETVRYHLPSWIDSAANSADPKRDPWGVMTPYNKVEHITADGQASDISHEFHLGNGNTPQDLTDNHLGHHNNQTPDQAYKGRIWYRGAHEGTKDLSDKTIGDHAKTVHTMSAYSPKTDWDENLEKGHHFLTHYSGDPNDPTGTGDPNAQITPGMQSPVRKAIETWHAPPEEVGKANSGPKTKAFANNILDATPMREPRPGVEDDTGFYDYGVNPHSGEPDWRMHPDHDTTADTHHVRMANTPHGDADAMRKMKYGTPPHFEAGLSVGGQDIRPGYDMYARMGAETTRRANLQEPDPSRHLIPKQLQAGPWGKFKDDLDTATGKTSPEPGQMPGGLTKQFDMKKNVDKSREDVEREWGEKNKLNNPIPRYQKERGDWSDPRRPDVDLRATPGWGRRSFVASTGSPIMDQWLGDYAARHPQHPQMVNPHMAAYEPAPSAHEWPRDKFNNPRCPDCGGAGGDHAPGCDSKHWTNAGWDGYYNDIKTSAFYNPFDFSHAEGPHDNPWTGPEAEGLRAPCPHCHADAGEPCDPHCPTNHAEDAWRDTKALGGPPMKVDEGDLMHRLNSVHTLLAQVDGLLQGEAS